MAMVNFRSVAGQLGVSVPKVRILVRQREIPHYRIGRRVVFDSEEVQSWLAGRRVPVGGSNGTHNDPSRFSPEPRQVTCRGRKRR